MVSLMCYEHTCAVKYTHIYLSLYIKSTYRERVFQEGTQPSNIKNRDIYWRRSKIQETLHLGQCHLSPFESRHLGTSHSSPSHHQLPQLYFPESHWWSEISSLSKVILVWEKPDIAGSQIWAVGGLSHWVIGCFTKKPCTRHDAWLYILSWWICQSLVAHSCDLLNHPSSFHGVIFKLNTKSDANSLLSSLSHFECDDHTVHMLTQWCLPPPLTSTVKSSLFTHAHSSPLALAARLHRCWANHSHYINNGWALAVVAQWIECQPENQREAS